MSSRVTRFLLQDAFTRGVIVKASDLAAEGNRIHGLNGAVANLFGETLIAAILLLSISKGGLRQVLQLDGPAESHAPLARILAEARGDSVRGFVSWREQHPLLHYESGPELGNWLGKPLRLSTVRDMGIGQPYISTIQHDSEFLADQLIHYLSQSAQIRADVIIRGAFGMLIEAMPGCSEEHWFTAVDAMARIPDDAIAHESADALLERFAALQCKNLGDTIYHYRCGCSEEKMKQAVMAFPAEQRSSLADEQGKLTLSCQYCDRSYELDISEF